ncbi:MAG: hypothetical protein KGY70_14730 [Bacteroidales bacterium]|nr:hypothetical protein [Bacteroidales bacterium]
MKTIIIALLIGMGFLWGCETRTYTFVSTISKDLVYTIDQKGTFSESYTLYADDFNEDLDLPEDAIIRGVNIESFAIKAEPQTGNEASSVKMNVYAGEEPDPFAEDVILPVDISFQAMPNLISSAVSELKDELEGFVKDSNPPSIAFRIGGDSEPAGERIFVVIRIKATITVAYDMESDIGL